VCISAYKNNAHKHHNNVLHTFAKVSLGGGVFPKRYIVFGTIGVPVWGRRGLKFKRLIISNFRGIFEQVDFVEA